LLDLKYVSKLNVGTEQEETRNKRREKERPDSEEIGATGHILYIINVVTINNKLI